MVSVGAWKQRMPVRGEALSGRNQSMLPTGRHLALGGSLRAEDFPGMPRIWFGMGCFWGAERKLWNLPGVLTTAAGYAGGYTPNPTYREVCTGMTGHAEVVMTVFDPARIALADLFKVFWESHDPTQGMRQGNDVGTQYRSAIFAADLPQLAAAQASARAYQQALTKAGRGTIATEITLAGPFYYAEDEHQQYLQRYPDGYCGLAGTGVACPM